MTANVPESVRQYLASIGAKGGAKGGRKGGRAKTRAKIAAARRNGKLGGRPRKLTPETQEPVLEQPVAKVASTRHFSTATVSSETVERWLRELEAAREREKLHGKGPLAQFYQTLGIPVGASKEQIKDAFRALAKQLHPDVSGDSETGSKFAAVRNAYEALMKTVTR